jgi:hypothetical protein
MFKLSQMTINKKIKAVIYDLFGITGRRIAEQETYIAVTKVCTHILIILSPFVTLWNQPTICFRYLRTEVTERSTF